MLGSMPKLTEFDRANAGLQERFLIVGVQQKGPKSLDEARQGALTLQAKLRGLRKEGVLPVLVLDADSGGLFTRFDPDGLGDMVLLDPRGTVAAVGEEAFVTLQRVLGDLRTRVSALSGRMEHATAPSEAGTAVGELCDLQVSSADAAVEHFVVSCPASLAQAAFEALLSRGRTAMVLGAMRDEDPKRRRAASGAFCVAPRPECAGPLLEIAAQKKLSPEDLCLALRAACACGPTLAEVEARVTDLAKKGDQAVRSCCLDLLGTLGTPSSKQLLLAVLQGDTWRGARLAAALALARVGGDDVVKALQRAASEDKIDTVRAAARQALEILSKRAAPPK